MTTDAYDLRTLEMVVAWCERQERRLAIERERFRGSLWARECNARRVQTTELRQVIQQHAAKARKKGSK